VQLDPAALSNAEALAAKRGECDGDDGLKGLVNEIQSENELLTDYIARRDALEVHHACSGIGTDEKARRVCFVAGQKKHLQAVDGHYREAHDGKKLFQLLKGETSGSLNKMFTWRSMELVEFRAAMMDAAMDGFGTDEDLLTETLVTCSNAEITELREYYEATRDKSLMQRITSETSGEFKMFLTKLLQAEKDESEDVDEGAAEEAAEKLYKAGVGNWWGTDEACFIDILVPANRKQCAAIATAYENARGKSLSKAIDKEFGGDTANGLNAMLCADKVDYLAKRLRKAMKGLGTDEEAICRVLAGAGCFETCRAVAARFMELEDRSLEDALKSELGGLFEGDFRRATLAMVADPPPHEPTRGEQRKVDELPPIDDDDADGLNARLDLLMVTNDALKEHIAFQDAHEIWKACNGGWTGIGTDEEALIAVIGNRTKDQLDRVDMQYRELFGKPLAEEIKGETSGNFKDMLLLMQMGMAECDAYLLHKATEGWGTDEEALIDVIAPKSPERLREMRDMFQDRYDKSLMDVVDSETSGWFESDFNGVIKALLSRSENVDEETEVDDAAAAEAAAALKTAMSGVGTDEQAVIDILCKANTTQIAAIRTVFENENGNSLESWLEGDFSGNAQDTLLALCAPPIDYYCRRLRQAMDGIGTDEDAITRVLGSLNKAELGVLKGRFFEKYDIDLDERLKQDVGGSWGKAVLTWVSGVDPTLGTEEEAQAQQAALEAIEVQEEAPAEEEEESDDDAKSEKDDDEDEDGEDEDEEEENERKKKRREMQKRKRREQLRKKKEKALKKQHLRKAAARCARERRLLKEAVEEFGEKIRVRMDAEFDGTLYCKQNDLGERSDRAAWRHFKKKGFWKGNLIRFATDDGVFIGALDLHRLLDEHEVRKPRGDEKPYTVDHKAEKLLLKGGKPDTLPVSLVIPVCVSGRIEQHTFKQRNRDLAPFWKKAKKAKLHISRMRARYPEIEEDFDDDPYKWLRRRMKKKVILQSGRTGKVDWEWYQEKYKPNKSVRRAMQFFKRKDWKHRPKLQIVNRDKMTVWEYYRDVGYKQGRTLFIKNGLGRFEGTFSEEGYAQANEIDAEEAWDHYKSAREDGEKPKISLNCMHTLKLFPQDFEVPDSDEEEDSEDEDSDAFDGEHDDSDGEDEDEEDEEDDDEDSD